MNKRYLLMMLFTVVAYGLNQLTLKIDETCTQLPVEGGNVVRVTTPPQLSSVQMFPLLAESKERASALDGTDIDQIFARGVQPPPEPVKVEKPPEKPKPSQAELFMQATMLNGVANNGAFINDRFYAVGESIRGFESTTRLSSVSVKTCEALVSVDHQPVLLKGNCR
ncbi:hypothetical protein RP726_05520 [Candidatus Methylospira mobilis]|uniref:hypothetical protein n=1 Tax=Candidatus Methylospira mobilis TaxID=1808979 RepID=UPI0028EDE4DD|nr:hypothetical protein [Candidatus Methylospira mobilis]WNV05871.1 hypothetical protein RP726_05520 [Candidatus Methylospira mobilis]